MTGQLQSDEESRRLAAVRLAGQLLSIEGSQLEQEAPHLASGFLGRLLDNKVGWCRRAQVRPTALGLKRLNPTRSSQVSLPGSC